MRIPRNSVMQQIKHLAWFDKTFPIWKRHGKFCDGVFFIDGMLGSKSDALFDLQPHINIAAIRLTDGDCVLSNTNHVALKQFDFFNRNDERFMRPYKLITGKNVF